MKSTHLRLTVTYRRHLGFKNAEERGLKAELARQFSADWPRDILEADRTRSRWTRAPNIIEKLVGKFPVNRYPVERQ
jgi:hypothetical protein